MKTISICTLWLVLLTSAALGQKDTITRFSGLSIDTMGNIKCTISYFGTGFSGCVEQYKNGKWTNIIGLSSYGSRLVIRGSAPKPKAPAERKEDVHSCTVKFHKGVNLYRIKSSKPSPAVSEEIKLISKVSNEDGSLWVSGTKIFLDRAEYYEILNGNGDLIRKGEEKIIDISSLSPGSYFFYTKTATTPFTK